MVNTGDMSVNPGNTSTLVYKYMRPEHLPHIWCPGCGNGIIMRDVAQAIENLGLSRNKTVIVSGIGCSSRAAGYLDFNTIHTTHGRAIAFATGIKLANPELEVIVLAGDGDISAIGGNHLIHAARRNLDVTVVMVNNLNFAMTGGQVAPTTPEEVRTMTTPYGNEEPRFDVCELAKAAGASHVERWSTAKPVQCKQAFKRALQHKGFSLIEIVSQCPTHFGRYALKTGDPNAVIAWIKENTYTEAEGKNKSAEELEGKLRLGQYICVDKPIYSGTSELR